ncbi:MAG: GTPase, partial [Patescibacteria group bacterium]
VIVSSVPHTTREPQDTDLDYAGKKIVLVDTAGISKNATKSKKTRNKIDLEKEGIERSFRSLNRSDIALLVLDISEDITRQDQKIADEIIGRKKSLIIIANKWDLILEKDTKKFTEYINYHLPFVKWAPIIFVSALTGRKTNDVMDLVLDINRQRARELSEKELDKFLKRIVKIHRPTRYKASDKYPYIKKIKQAASYPPEIQILIGAKESITSPYLRFIENQLRGQFGFLGTPISVRVKKGSFVHGQSKNILNEE